MVHRELTLDDMKDKFDMKGTLFDVLLATAERAREIYDEEKATAAAAAQTQPSRPKRRRQAPAAAVAEISDVDNNNRASSSTEPKRRRRVIIIPPNNREEQPPLPEEFNNVIEEMGPPAQTQPPAAAVAVAEIPDEDNNNRASSSREPNRRRVIINRPNNREDQPPLPEAFMNVIREMGQGAPPAPAPTLVIQKSLFSTDLSSGHNRLSIPISQIADDFLTDEEKQRLRGYDAKRKKNYLEVKIVEPSLAEETAKFCRWDMPKDGGKTSSCYVINGKWKSIVQKNNFRLGTIIQLWSFRVNGDLCFAIVRLPTNH